MYKLFLDDERDPVDDTFMVCRSSHEATILLWTYGPPVYMALDHDLGGDDTTMKYLRRVSNYMTVRMNKKFPRGFSYYVHSQNPVGRDNIIAFMDQMIQHIGIEDD